MILKSFFILALVIGLTSLMRFSEIELPKPFKKQFKFIPSGLVKIDNDTLSVQSFYMLEHEVTNAEYHAFLNTIQDEKIKSASQVMEQNWKTEFKLPLGGYSEHYFNHLAYAHYPVVNVTYEGATEYCRWLEKTINSAMEGKQVVKVRLPYHAELIRAALGENLNANYSWQGDYLRNSEGEFLCNFARIPQERLTKDEAGNLLVISENQSTFTEQKSSDVLAPSKSYYPSEYGVYNLNGNAAEMTNIKGVSIGGSWRSYGYDVRIQSQKNFEESSATVGFRPVFTVIKK